MSTPKFTIGQRVISAGGIGSIISIYPSRSQPGAYIYGVRLEDSAFREEELINCPPADTTASEKSA